jgi:predicted GIY-YIG superfamily endonuclease
VTTTNTTTGAVPARCVGTVYLLHFDRPYRHARHYLGWAQDVQARLALHACGRGARLLQVVRDAGIAWTLARTWPGTPRWRERQLKAQGGASRRCPLCGVAPRPDHPMVLTEDQIRIYRARELGELWWEAYQRGSEADMDRITAELDRLAAVPAQLPSPSDVIQRLNRHQPAA